MVEVGGVAESSEREGGVFKGMLEGKGTSGRGKGRMAQE